MHRARPPGQPRDFDKAFRFAPSLRVHQARSRDRGIGRTSVASRAHGERGEYRNRYRCGRSGQAGAVSRGDRNRHARPRIEGLGRLRDCRSSVRQGCSSRSGLSVRAGERTGPQDQNQACERRLLGFGNQARAGRRTFGFSRLHAEIRHGRLLSLLREETADHDGPGLSAIRRPQRPHGLLHLADCRRRCGIRVPAHPWDGRSASRRDKAPEECPVQDLRARRQVQGAAPLSGEADARKRREQLVRESDCRFLERSRGHLPRPVRIAGRSQKKKCSGDFPSLRDIRKRPGQLERLGFAQSRPASRD